MTSAFAHQPDNRMRLLVLAALLTGRRVPSAPPLPAPGSLASTMGARGHRDGSPWGSRAPILGSPQIPLMGFLGGTSGKEPSSRCKRPKR